MHCSVNLRWVGALTSFVDFHVDAVSLTYRYASFLGGSPGGAEHAAIRTPCGLVDARSAHVRSARGRGEKVHRKLTRARAVKKLWNTARKFWENVENLSLCTVDNFMLRFSTQWKERRTILRWRTK